LDKVEAEGLTENTLVVFVTDNGWIQDPEKPNIYAPGSKQDPQDMGIRTPIIYKWPKRIKPQMNTENLSSSIDIVPTTLAAVGLKSEANMEGINVMDEKAVRKRNVIYSLDFSHDMVQVDQPEKSLESRMIITTPWKMIVPDVANQQNKNVLLYNIIKDPMEKNNLATSNPKVVKDLMKTLDAWWDN
jgi:arylsulfatase A-like enzyme